MCLYVRIWENTTFNVCGILSHFSVSRLCVCVPVFCRVSAVFLRRSQRYILQRTCQNIPATELKFVWYLSNIRIKNRSYASNRGHFKAFIQPSIFYKWCHIRVQIVVRICLSLIYPFYVMYLTCSPYFSYLLQMTSRPCIHLSHALHFSSYMPLSIVVCFSSFFTFLHSSVTDWQASLRLSFSNIDY